MREIKFRAWNGKEMFYSWNGLPIYPTNDKKDLTWMQFTSLTDKNDKEIYEGDIVRVLSKPTFLTIVDFEDGAFFPVASKKVREESGFEVIGNIYESPELLENEEPKSPSRAN